MKYEIDIEGLPEGWKAVAYRVPKGNIEFVFIENVVRKAKPQDKKCLIVEKIQPRRIVLEETGCDYKVPSGYFYGDAIAGFSKNNHDSEITLHLPKTIWREVKETDIPLTNDEPNVKMGVIQGDCDDQKLELSVKELRNVRSLIKDFENLGWFINPERALLLQKITEFIKEN